jgi:cell division protein FtsN
MEDKKTLWIIIGIGVCVLVVAAVGFFWFLPSDQNLATAAAADGPAKAGSAGFDPVEWVRQDDSFPGIDVKEEAAEEFVVIADELVYGIPEESKPSESGDKVEKVDKGETITLNIPESTPVKKVPAVEIKPAVTIGAAVVQKPVEPAVKKPVRTTEYWIQAGSFSSLFKANEVKTELSKNGATSTISTTNVNGTDYYRVRLGPYSEQMEADKFLSWIKAVKGFENSYISEVYATK